MGIPKHAEEFFAMACAVKEHKKGARLFHWSAMEFRKHWRQRIGVVIAQGRSSAVMVPRYKLLDRRLLGAS